MFYYSCGSDPDQGLEGAGAVHGLSKKIDAGNIKNVSAPMRSKSLPPAGIELVLETKAPHPP
jgi:hypothetical protein